MLFNVCFKCSGNRGQALVVLYRTKPMCNRYKSKQEATTLGKKKKGKDRKTTTTTTKKKVKKIKQQQKKGRNIKETKTSKKHTVGCGRATRSVSRWRW